MPLRRATQREPFQETERPTRGGTATTSSAGALMWPIPLGMRCGRPDHTRDRQASEWRSPQLLFSPVDSSVQLFKRLRHPSVPRLPMVESPNRFVDASPYSVSIPLPSSDVRGVYSISKIVEGTRPDECCSRVVGRPAPYRTSSATDWSSGLVPW